MTKPAGRTPWLLARFAQLAIAAVAVAEPFRAVALRARRLHPSGASARNSGFTSMVFVYLMTAAVVLFLMWFSRCRRNARMLSPGAATGSAVSSVAVWFVPVVNLWVPRQHVIAVQRASCGSAMPEGRSDALVNTWWVFWAGHAVFTAGVTGQGTAMPLLVLSEVLNLGAAVLAICVIERITAQQNAALRGRPSAEPVAHA